MTSASGDSRLDVATIAAHELHHDVQAARQLLEQLKGEPAGLERSGALRRLEQSMALLERNIDRLLIEGGANLDRLQRSPTNLDDILRRVVTLHADDDHPIELRTVSASVNVDAIKFERIADNLLSNALAHTPPGCPVRVRLEVDIDAESLGVMLTVEDDGPGVPDEVRDALLSEVDQPPDPQAMGLWIVVKFARLHDGGVSIGRGANGRGACIGVRLSA